MKQLYLVEGWAKSPPNKEHFVKLVVSVKDVSEASGEALNRAMKAIDVRNANWKRKPKVTKMGAF